MPAINLDTKDRDILNFLQNDCRITNAELAEKISLSPSSCLRRVQRLEASGIIKGCFMLLDQGKAGKPTNIFVEISLSSQNEESLDNFEKAVQGCPEIMECYLMSGDSDYLLRVVAADAQDYERIHRQHLSNFPNVSQIRSNFALRTVNRKTVITF
ncbi:MAG: Lrp/AsnC family transcriptional regulator [Gammaproteobacteria bacterium]|nr:Lrp/AsnC family transcriptional regulator [Gammaproteobacteria bacterium]